MPDLFEFRNLESLALVFDQQMLDLREEMFASFDEEDLVAVTAFLHAAFGKGLLFGLKEREEAIKLLEQHGYTLDGRTR